MKQRKAKPAFSKRELFSRASVLVKTYGHFLLLYDVVSSRAFAKKSGARELYHQLRKFHVAVNTQCADFIVVREIGIGKNLTRFETILGDGGGAYFSDSCVIAFILKLANQLPFTLRWVVAKDGWDELADRILK